MNKSKINHKNYLKYKVNRVKKTYARILDTGRGLVFFPGIGMTLKDFFNIKQIQSPSK